MNRRRANRPRRTPAPIASTTSAPTRRPSPTWTTSRPSSPATCWTQPRWRRRLTCLITVELLADTDQRPRALPPQAGRGPTTFADRQQPQIVNEHGHDVLTLRLLGLLGDRTADDDGRSLTYYRDESNWRG
ncbi:MAG: hypothetical protein R2854_03415 [Caldilineaceae bacterium]